MELVLQQCIVFSSNDVERIVLLMKGRRSSHFVNKASLSIIDHRKRVRSVANHEMYA